MTKKQNLRLYIESLGGKLKTAGAIIAGIGVTLVISSIAAIAGYYLQTRLRRLEELEEERFAPAQPPPFVPRRRFRE